MKQSSRLRLFVHEPGKVKCVRVGKVRDEDEDE